MAWKVIIQLQGRQHTFKRNIDARSRNHCCRGKERSITYSESVFVALGTQCVMRMRHVFICGFSGCRGQLKCDGTRAETRFRLSAIQTSQFKSAGASVQSIAGSRVVRISGTNVGYTMFRGSVKSTGYPLHSPVSPSLPLPCVTMCHHISAGV
jgi:hypothetical protein